MITRFSCSNEEVKQVVLLIIAGSLATKVMGLEILFILTKNRGA